MFKRLFIVFILFLFLTACGKKDVEPEYVIPEGFQGPTSGPDPARLTPPFPPADEPSGAFDLSN